MLELLDRPVFDDDHRQFRTAFSQFLAREAVPRAEEWQRAGVIDRAFWRKAAANGFVAFEAPVQFGGLGMHDFRFNAVIDEEIVRSGVGTDAFMLTNDIVGPYLFNLANEDQKQRWLPGVADGSIVPVIAMSEPAAGSDLRGITSTATWDGSGYVLQGSKTFITSGIQADLAIVAARVLRDGCSGLGLFVVEAGMPGFSKGRKLEKIGRRAQDTAELFFSDVRVPESHVLGAPGEALRLIMGNLAQERLAMAISAVFSAELVLGATVQYVKDRHAFGRPVGSFQANRFTIADMVTDVRIGRVYVDDCIARHGCGELSDAEAAGAKVWATELEWRVLDTCLQLHGGYGYMEEYDIARRWRDARVQRIYGGTSEIMREIVGRSVGL